ncbi:MSCRAMM family protein [Lacticaseibacillus nasuensis]|uniref:MSCRAMM family protein n=1 Tax=Lacticaseibacillus nasuensis TaxID=944671 RepID=UPI0022483799|nr:SpaA isopeptide-forming pilin-related protein [Lacticaseibacillus nasuensis]MCX2455158.1 SpaA isopeptide-forming pilin-related protein [Lacticaseibacillus nasuensis]
MTRRIMHGLMILVLLFTQFQALVGIRPASAATTPVEASLKVLDQPGLTASLTGRETDAGIDWTLSYTKTATGTPRALKVKATVPNQAAPLTPSPAPGFAPVAATADAGWWIEAEFGDTSGGELKYRTAKTTRSLQVTVQVNTQAEAGEQVDTLSSALAGPHTLALPAPAPAPTESKAPAPTTAPKPAQQAKAALTLNPGETKRWSNTGDATDEFKTVKYDVDPATGAQTLTIGLLFRGANTHEAEITLPREWQLQTISGASDIIGETDANGVTRVSFAGWWGNPKLTFSTTKPADGTTPVIGEIESDRQTVALDLLLESGVSRITKPEMAAPVKGYDLLLTQDARAELKTEVLKLNGEAWPATANIQLADKGATPRASYSSEAIMKSSTSTFYVEGSSSRAVIFPNVATASDSRLIIDYDWVGYIKDATGNAIPIGAYVEVDQFKYRDADWGSANPKMGFDVSNNFYSGMTLANIRSFDWDVTFYVVDNGVKRAVDFVQPDDDEAAVSDRPLLTFTSLNPGEFVKSHADAYAHYKAGSVAKLGFGPDNTPVLSNPSQFNGIKDSTNPEISDVYTAVAFGYWPNITGLPSVAGLGADKWHDWLGSSTFGRGAVSFNLTGTSFKYTRGTYAEAGTTWLANASGANRFDIPTSVVTNKSVTANPNAGGGDKTVVDRAKASDQDPMTFTPNELDGENINDFYDGAKPLYYYINQELYSLTSQVIMRPNQIEISDLLPAGIDLKDAKNSVTLYNARAALNGGQDIISVPAGQITLREEAGRTRVTVKLLPQQIDELRFEEGFMSLRLDVKLTERPSDWPNRLTMNNRATVKMWDVDNEVGYDRQTNNVSTWIQETKVPGVDVAFTKTDAFGVDLTGAQFTLTAGQSSVNSVADGSQIQFKGVTPGEYTLTETHAPNGYVLPEEGIKVTVTADSKIVWPADYATPGEVANTLKPFSIRLRKTGDGKDLGGAKLRLEGLDHDFAATGVTSADDGITRFDGKTLRPGRYRLTELEAPNGFKLMAGPLTFTINNRGELVDLDYSATGLKADQVTVTTRLMASDTMNQLNIVLDNNKDDFGLPSTGGSGYWWQLAIAMTLMLSALGYWFYRYGKEVA